MALVIAKERNKKTYGNLEEILVVYIFTMEIKLK